MPAVTGSDNAFPCHPEARNREDGMTLRDYFAATALQGLLACPSLTPQPESMDSYLSKWAYKYADAMLKASEEEES